MAKRIFSTVTLWLSLFAVLWFFRTAGAVVLIVAISVLTLREFYRLMAAAGGRAPLPASASLFGGLITLAPWTEVRYGIPAAPLLILAALVFTVRMFLERAPEKRVEALCSTLFGLVYVSLMLQYLVRL